MALGFVASSSVMEDDLESGGVEPSAESDRSGDTSRAKAESQEPVGEGGRDERKKREDSASSSLSLRPVWMLRVARVLWKDN
jgi:hypothetical protein